MYKVSSNPDESAKKELEEFNILEQKLLFLRGISNKKDAVTFFNKDWDEENIDPFKYSQMPKAIERTIAAIESGEVIGIYGDYDCDGLPASAALNNFLSEICDNKIIFFTPNRNVEGFGINDRGVDSMKEAGLVFVIDCGTSDKEGIDKLNKSSDVIILDHHLPGEEIPNCVAIINPVFEDIEKPHPCAAGVVFKFLEALTITLGEDKVKKGREKWQLDLVGISTMSDMVSLFGNNRLFVHYGLKVLKKTRNVGLQALCQVMRVDRRGMTETDIAFSIAPVINSASKIGNADLVFELLTTKDMTRAIDIAKELKSLNEKRKRLVATMVKQAHKIVQLKDKSLNVWVIGDRKWRAGSVGLVAQRIGEEYGKTVFAWGTSEDGFVKGSCRSKIHNLHKLMEDAGDLFSQSGGHEFAAGFTLKGGAEIMLEEKLNELVEGVEAKVEKLEVEIEDSVNNIRELDIVLDKFSPFGMDNKRPLIAIPNCKLVDIQVFGKGHSKFKIKDDTGEINSVLFFKKLEEEDVSVKTIIGSVEKDSYTNQPKFLVSKIISQ